jgi:hypothetical protein
MPLAALYYQARQLVPGLVPIFSSGTTTNTFAPVLLLVENVLIPCVKSCTQILITR